MTEAQKKRGYHSAAEIESELDDYLVAMRKRGELRLPSERDLALAVGCSRSALRGVLERKAKKGILDKDHLGYGLSMESAANSRILGAVAFISTGRSIIGNPAWDKLWTCLKPKLEHVGISANLVLTPFFLKDFNWSKILSNLPELVVTTTSSRDVFERLQAAGHVLLSTEENLRGIAENIVAMDNFKAGMRAAEMLAAHGYKRPAMILAHNISSGRFYVPYARRLEGFKTGCLKLGLVFREDSLIMVQYPRARLCIEMAAQAKECPKRGFDSIFLHSDDDIDFLMEGLSMGGFEVPRDIGVVTINSFDHAINYSPQISAVAHGTEPVACKIVEKAKAFFERGERCFGECLITPGVHEGETLK